MYDNFDYKIFSFFTDNILTKYLFLFQSYRFYPANFDVIEWLGSYFGTMQVRCAMKLPNKNKFYLCNNNKTNIMFKVPEKALTYFQEAVELAPDQPKWRLSVAQCLRRTGQFHKALAEYQDMHIRFPDNIECLKCLVRLSSDMGLKEAQTYAIELRKAEKAKETKERHGSGRPGTTSEFE